MKRIHIDLFSGIGGGAIAVDEVFGKENIQHIFCDNEPFSQTILKKHWPDSTIVGDVRAFTANATCGGSEGREISIRSRRPHESATNIDRPFILTGGFPCQPFSQAGRRKGTDDDRHLWPEMLRVIREFRPEWIIGENVAGFLTWGEGVVLEQVCTDLEAEGYEVQPFVIPAVAVNAPHRRDRVWIVANAKYERARDSERGRNDEGSPSGTPRSDSNASNTNYAGSGTSAGRANEIGQEKIESRDEPFIGTGRQNSNVADPESEGGKLRSGRKGYSARSGEGISGRNNSFDRSEWDKDWLEVATKLCTLDDGLPDGSPRPRGWRNAALKGAGNAWVPQVAIEIMKAIKKIS